MREASKIRPRLAVLAAALLFSTGGAAIKITTLSVWQVAGFRAGIGALALYAAFPKARRGWTLNTWLTGFAYAATVILFVAANKTTTAANAIFLENTAPLYMLILGPLALQERVRKIDLGVIGAVGAGVLLMLLGSEGATASAPHPAAGNIISLISGFTWALTITGLRRESRQRAGSVAMEDAGAAAVIAGNIVAFAVCLPMALPVHEVAAMNLAAVMYLGLLQVGLAYVFLTRSLKQVRGLEASTLLLTEPVLNPVWTWLVQGERPGFGTLAGGALIILSTLAATAWRSKYR